MSGPIDYRANAERALSTIDASDDPRNLPAGLDGIGSALLALHDLLDERLPKPAEPERKDAPERPDPVVSSRFYIPNGEFSLQITSDGISDDLYTLLTGTAKPVPHSTGESVDLEPAEVTEDQPVGTYLVDRDGDVWKRREHGWHLWSARISAWGSRARTAAYPLENYAPLRLATPADLARVGIETDLTPADDLPGEPVEPGDLRAGDRVAFSWGGERITCDLCATDTGALRTLEGQVDGGSAFVVGAGGLWSYGISDVRLIERAPREDEDPDEALADLIGKTLWPDDPPWAERGTEARGRLVDVARAAREHIEAEVLRKVERATDDRYDRALDRAEKAEAERDALRERLDAFRADVESLRDAWKVPSILSHAVPHLALDQALARDDALNDLLNSTEGENR